MNCSQYLVSELQILKDIKVILMLGKVGFDAYCRAAGLRKLRFSHGASYEINGKMLLASYHPSRQNTNTGKLTWHMWFDIFKKARSILGS
jgi:uracil-DNA glycosylase